MRRRILTLTLALTMASPIIPAIGQHGTPIAATAATTVPALVRYSGVAMRNDGKIQTGETSITFLLFKDEKGGDPLWVETQQVAIDSTGHYEVQLGATNASGMPTELFATGEARWLEVQIAGATPQPRVLLVSVPYAMKAADAATLGGLPASAFVLAGSQPAALATTGATPLAVVPDSTSTVTTTGGTTHHLSVFSGTNTVTSSEIYDTGTSVGIGDVPNAGARLDVNGPMIMRGAMTVSRTGNATSSKGYPSYGFDFYSNAYNSSTKAADNPHFILQSEPTGNNSSNTGATFNLLYSNHGAAPAETGLSINPSGVIHFASGQSFDSTSTSANAVQGESTSGDGVLGGSNSGSGVAGNSNGGNGVRGFSNGTTVGTAGVLGIAGTRNTSGFGGIAGAWGDASEHVGVLGTSDYFAGVQGLSLEGPGVQGFSTQITGVYGESAGASAEGTGFTPSVGVWADTNLATYALLATADDGYGALIANNSSNYPSLHVIDDTNGNPGATIFKVTGTVYNGDCFIDDSGDFFCNGDVGTFATLRNAPRQVETYNVQSAESWFEDFGSAKLTNGKARVQLEPIFQQTVNTSVDYHVFLTPDGDCKGLYISEKSSGGFEVRELGGGSASIPFEYRIVAKRAGHENRRLVDITEQRNKDAEVEARLRHPVKRISVSSASMPSHHVSSIP